MLFYAISLRLSKENMKSSASSVANDISDNGTTKETMPRSISKEEGAK